MPRAETSVGRSGLRADELDIEIDVDLVPSANLSTPSGMLKSIPKSSRKTWVVATNLRERHGGVSVGREEVGGAEVGVTIGLVGVDGRDLDRRPELCAVEVVSDNEPGVNAVEAAADEPKPTNR